MNIIIFVQQVKGVIMKKFTKVFLVAMSLAFVLTGCGGSYVPKDWATENINYYKVGFKDQWKHEDSDYIICPEMKDPNTKFGYLLTDLDGDGGDELLIGIIDDAKETKFCDLIIYHKDLGPTRSFSCGDGYYFYLCAGNVIKMDSWYGSETKTEYMKYDSSGNSFPVIDSTAMPKKFDLIPLN
jgi:hypothetical protein